MTQLSPVVIGKAAAGATVGVLLVPVIERVVIPQAASPWLQPITEIGLGLLSVLPRGGSAWTPVQLGFAAALFGDAMLEILVMLGLFGGAGGGGGA